MANPWGAEPSGGAGELLIQPRQRRLEQKPAPTWWAVSDQIELSSRKSRHHRMRELPTAEHPDRDPRTSQRVFDLRHPMRQNPHVADPRLLDMGRSHDCPGALSGRHPRQLDTRLHRRRTVVDARQQMKVQFGVAHRPMFRQPRRQAGNDLVMRRRGRGSEVPIRSRDGGCGATSQGRQ